MNALFPQPAEPFDLTAPAPISPENMWPHFDSSSPNATSVATSSNIVNAALTIKAMIDLENDLDDKRKTHDFTPADGDEEGRLYDARMAHAEQLIQAAPQSTTDSLIIVMHAVDRLNFANSIVEGGDIIDECERAIRRACTFMAQELGVDLSPFGSESFLPVHLSEQPAGRA